MLFYSVFMLCLCVCGVAGVSFLCFVFDVVGGFYVFVVLAVFFCVCVVFDVVWCV